MNTFYEPLLQMEAFDQIREAMKKEGGEKVGRSIQDEKW